jgi:hypothetical protein
MPLPIVKEVVTPNSIYFPQITFATTCANGKMIISADISLRAAKVDDVNLETETWTQAAGTATIHIADIMNLDEDIAAFNPQMQDIYNGFLELIQEINEVREVL